MEVRNWKTTLGQTLAIAAASVLGVALVGNALGGILGAVVGLAVAFGAEHVLGLRSEVQRLQNIEGEMASAKEARAEERRLQQHEVLVAKRRAEVAEVQFKVWADAHREAEETGNLVPGPAIIARCQVMLEAKNLHTPLPPP
jgi:L-lactate permease